MEALRDLRRSLADGVYVDGTVNGMELIFTADTGASRPVISSKAFDKLPSTMQPKLVRSACLVGAGSVPVPEVGKGGFEISPGPHKLIKQVIVADIEDEALLGYDILMGSGQGPAEIILSQNKIVLDGKEIPVFQVGRGKCSRRVTVADDVKIPGLTEALVDVYIEREKNQTMA
ncbi:hypothetical protein DPMN_071798 [Dreissena polymorpha]|uniref:Peptidase A2 domain-containing protein n=1 Tax=Dreissena polymorpha TaxID=45954 RepID=A0A9D3Z576_DREPO|nr:hypothetical protein DPMN_071798 [Dreissena polymorpha]